MPSTARVGRGRQERDQALNYSSELILAETRALVAQQALARSV